ncbi:MAG: hypothetical protein NVSMB42_21370 [Herpetosiphon sp.]
MPQERSVQTVITLGYSTHVAALRLRRAPDNVRSAVPEGRTSCATLVRWDQHGSHPLSCLDEPG